MVDILTVYSCLKWERKTEIGGGYKCAGVHAQGDTHAQMKTEESPVLLMRLLAHGRSGDGADVFYRGYSK